MAPTHPRRAHGPARRPPAPPLGTRLATLLAALTLAVAVTARPALALDGFVVRTVTTDITGQGTVVSNPAGSVEFFGWGVPCAQAAACSVTVTGNSSISAGFRARVQTLTLTLQAPANRDDGAILLTLTGPAILALRPGAGLELAEVRDAQGAAARSRVLLRGTLAAGALLQVDVPGSATASRYTATVQQVAARASGSYARRADLAAYQLTLR